MQPIFKKNPERKEIIDKIISYLKLTGESSATYDRVNTMVEFLQCYPILVKKNKNASPGMCQMFPLDNQNPNQKPEPSKRELDQTHIEKLIEFTWAKIRHHYQNTSHAFRFFDSGSKQRIKKQDFFEGLDKLYIRLSIDDKNKLWKFLDVNGKGRINFTDFCALGDCKSKHLNDPFEYRQMEARLQEGMVK